MTATRTSYSIVLALSTALLLPTAAAGADQDPLAGAKNLYLSAAYDEALAAFDRLQHESPNGEAGEAAQYRVFCLIALQRSDEARRAIEAIVNADPFYRPSDTQTSPRIRTVFQDVRRALLPGVVQRSYADARAAFDRKDPKAAAQFDRLLALLDDPDMKGTPALPDLRTVVSGFRDLSQATAAINSTPGAPARPTAAAAATTAAPGGSETTRGDKDAVVTPPVALSQGLPRWEPGSTLAAQRFFGTIEVIINEQGNVTSATLIKSVHPAYDSQLLKTARTWKYTPAMKNGQPTTFVKVIDVQLRPAE